MNKLHRLHRSQLIRKGRDEVFQFFSRAENLEKITPPNLSFHIMTPGHIPMHVGQTIDYSISIFGLPMRWTSAITDFKEPKRFIDLQLRGPYAYWHHMHRFEAIPGGTMVEDEVHYQMPYGVIGEFAHWIHVKRRLNAIFDYRAKVIQQVFEEGGIQG